MIFKTNKQFLSQKSKKVKIPQNKTNNLPCCLLKKSFNSTFKKVKYFYLSKEYSERDKADT